MGSNTDRPPTPVSKSSVRGSQTSSQQEPTSTLLQEKLQRERRSEIQRNLNRLAGEMNTAADAQQAATPTPVRCATADGKRPESSDTNGDTGKKKGLALKEMEQVLMAPLHPDLITFYSRHLPRLVFDSVHASCHGLSHLPGHNSSSQPTSLPTADNVKQMLLPELLTRPCAGNVDTAQTEF